MTGGGGKRRVCLRVCILRIAYISERSAALCTRGSPLSSAQRQAAFVGLFPLAPRGEWGTQHSTLGCVASHTRASRWSVLMVQLPSFWRNGMVLQGDALKGRTLWRSGDTAVGSVLCRRKSERGGSSNASGGGCGGCGGCGCGCGGCGCGCGGCVGGGCGGDGGDGGGCGGGVAGVLVKLQIQKAQRKNNDDVR